MPPSSPGRPLTSCVFDFFLFFLLSVCSSHPFRVDVLFSRLIVTDFIWIVDSDSLVKHFNFNQNTVQICVLEWHILYSLWIYNKYSVIVSPSQLCSVKTVCFPYKYIHLIWSCAKSNLSTRWAPDKIANPVCGTCLV